MADRLMHASERTTLALESHSIWRIGADADIYVVADGDDGGWRFCATGKRAPGAAAVRRHRSFKATQLARELLEVQLQRFDPPKSGVGGGRRNG
jgi:hypothetical protein